MSGFVSIYLFVRRVEIPMNRSRAPSIGAAP